jgi:hypothetical protein
MDPITCRTAILGHRLRYAFLILAAWRVMLELSKRLERTRIAFLIVAIVAAGALIYQGKRLPGCTDRGVPLFDQIADRWQD